MEYREFRAESVSVGDDGVIEGLVTPFGRETTIGDPKRGGFREEVAPGCFRKTLNEGDALMIWQHNMSMPLARSSAGNLELREGSFQGHDGLVVNANPVDTSYAQDMRKLAKAGVLGGFSFGFNVVKDSWYDDEGRESDKFSGTKRVLREVQLIEVSPVTRPAYGGTILNARDESSALQEERAAKPYGDVEYADPKNGKYPIDTKEHVTAAWDYINVAANAAKYPLNGVSLASVKSKIKAAAGKFGIKISEENAEVEEQELRDPYEDSFYESGDRDKDASPERQRDDQEPDASTPDDEDRNALMRQMLQRATAEGDSRLVAAFMSREPSES